MSDGFSVIERTLETPIHGRYLVSPGGEPRGPVLVGFHGYAETAEEELRRLRAIPGSDRWSVVSVQGLHQFYRRRTDEVVASWMTRQNRELAIEDNIAFVGRVIRHISENFSLGSILVMTGFSQGAAMAYRAAATVDGVVAGVIACGGDVPPEIAAGELARVKAVLIGRGARDEWYTAEKMAVDEGRLRAAAVSLETMIFDAAHEWTVEFDQACSRFLQSLLAKEMTL
jgi:predicted esterase